MPFFLFSLHINSELSCQAACTTLLGRGSMTSPCSSETDKNTICRQRQMQKKKKKKKKKKVKYHHCNWRSFIFSIFPCLSFVFLCIPPILLGPTAKHGHCHSDPVCTDPVPNFSSSLSNEAPTHIQNAYRTLRIGSSFQLMGDVLAWLHWWTLLSYE